MALGISAAAGSFGQFALLPLTQMLLTHVGWYGALLTLAAIGLLMAPLAAVMIERREHRAHAFQQSAGQAVREALGHLFNIIGTYTTGWLGAKMPKRYILSFIYFARAVLIALFIWLPLSAWSVYAFASALGLLWLSTVPPTNGIVGQIFGVRYMAMLTGVTFFSHQIGSFVGAWLGGFLFDQLGSYDLVWYLSIALGVVASLINLPIDEREIKRPAVAKPAA